MLLSTPMVRDPVYDFDEEEGPDSQIRTLPPGTKMHLVVVRVSNALANGWVTLTLTTGEVLYEGDMPGALIELRVPVPAEVKRIKITVEAGSKYRNAEVLLGSNRGDRAQLRLITRSMEALR